MSDAKLTIKSGLPYSKLFVVTLPTDRDWWSDISQFEVLMQIREEADRASRLILDLSPYLTTQFNDADTFQVLLSMTGADTRLLNRSGFYDVYISDVGITDGRAYQIGPYQVKRTTVVTAEVAGME